MRLAFAGTPEFAQAALEALHQAGHRIALVLTQPDRPAGRGLKLHASAVKQWALAHQAPLIQPRSLRLDGKYPDDARAAQAALEAAAPEAMVVAAYGLLLPRWTLALPPLGCLNIHGSLLPRWRGAAPIQRAIEAGDAETGITIMQMDEGLDTGPMLLERRLPITAQDTSASLFDKLTALGAQAIVQALALPTPWRATAQPAQGVSHAAKIAKEEGAIDWTQSAVQIERRVRAFDPFPGCQFESHGLTLKLWRAQVLAGVQAPPGTCVALPAGTGLAANTWCMACGEGALALLEVQAPGGKRVDAAQWLASQTRKAAP